VDLEEAQQIIPALFSIADVLKKNEKLETRVLKKD
jgi:hypothetical protein